MLRICCGCLLALSILSLSLGAAETGPRPLFDGQTLNGWKPWPGDEKFWRVENGAIVGESTPENPCPHNTFLLWELGEVDDFELRLKFRLTGSDAANSGIQFRGALREDGHVVGYQADIDRKGNWVGCLYDEAMPRKLLATRGQKVTITSHEDRQTEQLGDAAELFTHVKPDDWNEYTINARGNVITLSINGHQTVQIIDNDPEGLDRFGKLALQLHSGPPQKIEFKEITLQRFPLETGWKKVVFVAGTPSHRYFEHEHNAGCLLLAEKLNTATRQHALPVVAAVYTNGWPKDPTAMDNVDCVVSYCDGGPRHYLNDRLEDFDRLVSERGVGLVCLHYGVETTKGPCGEQFLKWIGGYFEPDWSVNPHWTANFKTLPDHPIARGVQPFEINDEWYFHMRFMEGMQGVTPILTDLPPRDTMERQDGPHSGNPYVRAAILERMEPQHVAWAYERPNGKGRGFGLTGGHFHKNWQNDSFRKVVLNAIVWTANLDVPAAGVESAAPTDEELEENRDPKPKPDAKPQAKAGRHERRDAAPSVAVVTTPPDPHAAPQAIEQLDVHPALEATLFASEPMMTNPASIDVDHLGRVWVCEAVNYRAFRNADIIGNLARDGDRILVLHDTNGDAAADKAVVFYQGHDVDSAQGILVLPAITAGSPGDTGLRAIVSALDSVFCLIDDDGDLRADRKELLFTGISGAQHDHGVHACHFGPDGKLYFNFGNEGKQLKDKDGRPVVDRAGNEVNNSRRPYQEGMVFRCNLDGSDVETLGWNFRNNWEACVDSFGTIWQSDNDDDGNRGVRINYVMEYGNYGYKDELTGAGWKEPRTNLEAEIPHQHWHLNDPGVIPNLLQTGAGAPTGICFYEGELLPQALRGAIIHCDAGPNICRAYVPQAVGAGYSAETVNLLSGARQQWFRPSDVCVAPDGSLLVADWYDPGVGGHRMQDVARGRIFRLAPPKAGHKYAAGRLDLSSAEGAVAALLSPNMTSRYLGWTALHKLGENALPALAKLWNSPHPVHRARALGVIVKLPVERSVRLDYLARGLRDAAADVRCLAVRLGRQFPDLAIDEITPAVNLNDPSPAVRRELLIGLRERLRSGPTEQLISAWVELARQYDGRDRWYLEALGLAADGSWNECVTAYLRQCGENWTGSRSARDIVWRSRADATPQRLTQIITSAATPASELPRYLRAFDFQISTGKPAAIERLAFGEWALAGGNGSDGRAAFVHAEALSRIEGFDINSRPERRATLLATLDATRGTPQYVRLIARFSVVDRYGDILQLAQADPQSQTAVEAVKTLLDKQQQALFRPALVGDDPALAEATIQALAASGDGRAVKLFTDLLHSEQPLSRRKVAMKAMGALRQGAVELQRLAEKGDFDPGLAETLAATLHTVQWKDVKEFAAKNFPLPPGKDSLPLPPIAELASRHGDSTLGSVLYHSTATCAQCHQVGMLGKNVGPNLSEIGKKLTREALWESLLYPSAAISHNFENWLVVDTDGNQYTGLLVSDTDTAVELKDAKGFVHSVPRGAIEILKKQDVSLMPADVQKSLSVQELVDVVEYLTTLK